jgi:hypothetical protein
MEHGIPLPELHVGRYRFVLEPLEPISLPRNAGSTLRGGLGYVLKRLTCYHSGANCAECGLGNDCVYGYLMLTSPPEDSDVLSTLTSVARPFVIQPPLQPQETFQVGQQLRLHVVLFGRGIAYLPYFVLAFQQLGDAGLGPGRGRLRLAEVTALGLDGEAEVFDQVDAAIHETDLSISAENLAARAAELPQDQLSLAFVTSTRLKHQGQFMGEGPPFHVLIRRLLDRVSSLSYFHCGERWDIDFKGWIERAKHVEIADAATRWADWERYSGRQEQRIKMGGLVGPVTYVGDVAPFRALLALGTLVHVGKGTVMGNGRFAVKGLDSTLRT